MLFVTPSLAQIIYSKGLLTKDNSTIFTTIIDKIDMHQAFDLDQDLIELSKSCDFAKRSKFTIFTMNSNNSHQDE